MSILIRQKFGLLVFHWLLTKFSDPYGITDYCFSWNLDAVSKRKRKTVKCIVLKLIPYQNTINSVMHHVISVLLRNLQIVAMLIVICLLLLIGQSAAQYTYLKRGRDHGHGTVGESSTFSCPGLWSTLDNTTGRCVCGNWLGGVVHCDETFGVHLHPCFCMSFYEKDPNITVVGACMYMCHDGGLVFKNASDLSDNMCGKGAFVSNREGQLCGRCEEGFAPPAYSYDWQCVQCNSSFENLVKYCIIVFLPLTIFFVLVITFRISATSPSMNAFLLACQVLTSPLQVRVVSSAIHDKVAAFAVPIAVIESLYGFWNLDFFRTLYPRFCLHPNISTLQVLALDYVIAVYPLLLTGLTYLLVELHNCNCKLTVWLWKPFHGCFTRLRGQWDIQTSLIEAFVSFLLFSYVKFLSVSFDFLVPVHLYNVHGESMETCLYYDGTVEYFGKQHLPYAILAIVVLSIFNILPLLLLCLYPCHCFQKILNACKLRRRTLHVFMDAFQGCYKNGTNGTKDCRYFSAIYLFMRISFFVMMAMSLSISRFVCCFIGGMIFTLFAILLAVVRPYKLSIHNTIDTVLILITALIYFCISASTLVAAPEKHSGFHSIENVILSVFILVPLFYMTVLLLYWLFFRHKKMAALLRKVRLLYKSVLRQSNSEESLPDRLANPEECAALLQDPMSVYQDTYNAPDQLSF